jgi:hypothetical protein
MRVHRFWVLNSNFCLNSMFECFSQKNENPLFPSLLPLLFALQPSFVFGVQPATAAASAQHLKRRSPAVLAAQRGPLNPTCAPTPACG